jgi:protein-tyrosine-phosphatase
MKTKIDWTRILFVCSGNTCRSAMAEKLAQSMGFVAAGCGTWATQDKPMNPYAVVALQKAKIDNDGSHKARGITKEIVAWGTVILCMDSGHLWELQDSFPEAKNKTFMLKQDGDIDDPFGSDQAIYDATFQVIKACFETALVKGLELPEDTAPRAFCPQCGKPTNPKVSPHDLHYMTYDELLCLNCDIVREAEKVLSDKLNFEVQKDDKDIPPYGRSF